MAARKKTAGKRAPKKAAAPRSKGQASAKKKAAPKKGAATKKKASAKTKKKKKKASANKKTTSKPKAATEKKTASGSRSSAKKTAGASISTMDVNLGHVFSLKPRVNTSFRQNDFLAAKRALREEKFGSITDAARAVAEEALALTRGDTAGADSKRHRRSSNPAR